MAPVTTGPDGPVVAIVWHEHPVDGYLHGVGQTYLQARLRLRPLEGVDWPPIDAALAAAAPLAPPPTGLSDAGLGGLVERLVNWTAALQRAGGDGVFEPGRLLAQSDDIYVIALPTLDPAIASQGLRLVARVINAAAAGGASAAELVAAVRDDASQLAERARQAFVSLSTRRLLAAARRRGVPWLRLGKSNAFQLGYGARGRWIRDSFTDETPAIGTQISRSKSAAASVLRQVGVPVPP